MKKIKKKLILWLKKNIDKIYYTEYTFNKETLIREMFPWITGVWEYEALNVFFRNSSPNQIHEFIKIIWAYYRWEVQRLTLEDNPAEIKRFQWLLDFAQALKDYQDYILIENNKIKDNK